MNKQEFLEELGKQLSGLPRDDIEERLAFYGEMIDDRIEEGLSEEEAVSLIGPIGEIVSQTVSDVPLTKIVKERVRPKRTLKGWEIALIILGFPLWFPLLLAFCSVVFSLYVVLWSLIVSLWAVELSFLLSSLASLVASVVLYLSGNPVYGTALLGIALVFAGLSVFLFFGCLAASKGTARLTKKMFLRMKTRFVKKEEN